MPRVLHVDPSAPAELVLSEAVAVLRAGGLLGLPTETVYGLGARALDAAAVARIFAAKGRPSHHPLIAHVLGEPQAAALAAAWPERASQLARAFWPGPLTIVVARADHVPAAVAGGGESIALRAPSHPVARAVLARLGEPIAAPSANRYQGLSPTLAEHVVRQLGAAVDLVIDAGPCEAGIESTVVDVRGPTPRVLRPGALGVEALRRVLPEVEAVVERAAREQPRASPGMDERHYAPRAPLVLSSTPEEAAATASRLAAAHGRAGLVVRGHAPSGPGQGVVVRLLPDEPAPYAQVLYRALHELDAAGVAAIVVQAVPDGDAWWAVADRLRRAAARPR